MQPRPDPWKRQEKPRERLWVCGQCQKQHAYRDWNGQLVSCGWCCSNKFHTHVRPEVTR